MRRKIVVPNNALLDDAAKIIASGENVVLLTKGQSMLPFIVGGRDSVELSKIDREIEFGDIVLAKISNPERYVIHRVIKIEGDVVTLMGDGNLIGVEVCRKCDVAAKITSIIKPNKMIDPNSKRWQKYAKLWRALMPIRRYLLAIIRRVAYSNAIKKADSPNLNHAKYQ